ncbi:hypothetical protein Tco_0026697 [Tanacetum coccineum]
MMLCKQESKGPSYDVEPLEKVHIDDDYNVFANEKHHFEQHKSINDTYFMEKTDRNVNPNSSDMCNIEGKADQIVDEPEDERVLLASLIANLKLDIDEDKMKHKQLKKANISLTQELEKSKQDIFLLQISVVELNWKNRVQNEWNNSITHDVKVLFKEMLIPLAQDTMANASLFETHLKKKMSEDLQYVQSH